MELNEGRTCLPLGGMRSLHRTVKDERVKIGCSRNATRGHQQGRYRSRKNMLDRLCLMFFLKQNMVVHLHKKEIGGKVLIKVYS